MGYGGIVEVEIDEEHGFFYVKREGNEQHPGGYWNRYKISSEGDFLDWLEQHREQEGSGDIPFYGVEDENEEEEVHSTYDDFDDWNDDPNEDFGSWG